MGVVSSAVLSHRGPTLDESEGLVIGSPDYCHFRHWMLAQPGLAARTAPGEARWSLNAGS
jgi:hypothetical protein